MATFWRGQLLIEQREESLGEILRGVYPELAEACPACASAAGTW